MARNKALTVRVLFVTPWYPTEAAPTAGIFIRDHALAASDQHDVRVLHLDFDSRDRTGSIGPPSVSRWRIPLAATPAGYLFSLAATILALVVLAVRYRFIPDLIHGHVYKVTPNAWLAARLTRAKWVHAEHWSGYEMGIADGLPLQVAHRTFPRADRILPVSDHLREVMAANGIHGSYEVVWNPVDVDAFHPPEQPLAAAPVRLLFVGLLDDADNKNVGGLLQSLAGFGEPWTLTVVGDGPALERHREAALDLGIEDQVVFTGLLERAQVADHMSSHHVLVHMAHVETFCIVVGEALAAGLIVLATPTGAIPEMLRATGGGRLVCTSADLISALRDVSSGELTVDREAVAAAARRSLSRRRLALRLDGLYREIAG